MIPASPHAPTYRCPGEDYDISRAVHFARLASGFDRCGDCVHRDGLLPGPVVERATPRNRPTTSRRSLFTSEGVRGVHLNELTRTEAAHVAGAFASCLWDEFAPAGDLLSSVTLPPAMRDQSDVDVKDEGVTVLPPSRPGPIVVLAHDERPASPDLVMGVGLALRRMGCQVVDVGPVTRPCFWFAVHQLRAAGGIHVTGSGCDPAWSGLDFVRQGPVPCSRGGDLDLIEARCHEGYGRPSRRPGTHRLYSATAAYEAGLWRHFHALRPFRIALACSNRLLSDLLFGIFRKSACRLIPVETPTRGRELSDDRDPDVVRLLGAVRQREAHLGLLVDDDAQSCALFDEKGNRAAMVPLLRIFTDFEREASSGEGVSDFGFRISEVGRGPASGSKPSTAEFSLGETARTIRMAGAHCEGGASGRFWFVDAFPTCDAVLTLVKLLQILSRSDTPFSEVLGNQAS